MNNGKPNPEPEFLEFFDALTVSRRSPSATVRVAEVHFGDRSLAPAIEAAGMEVAASLDGKRERPDFDVMPEFDLVVASVPDSPDEWEESVRFIMRFLRVRRPEAFVILGCMEDILKDSMDSVSEPYGYEVSQSRKDGIDFIAGLGVSGLDFEEIALNVLQEIVKGIKEGAEESD